MKKTRRVRLEDLKTARNLLVIARAAILGALWAVRAQEYYEKKRSVMI
jgi:hypothetical protein